VFNAPKGSKPQAANATKNLMNKSSSSSIKKFISSTLALFFFCLLAYACGKDENIVPSNITLAITIQGVDDDNPAGDGSGIITCVTTAKNAVRYAYQFAGGELQESVDGTLEHTFVNTGINTYPVLVFAYSSSGEAVNTTQSVTVFQADNEINTPAFADEFDTDGPVNSETWISETNPPNNGSWFNGEKQHYTDRIENAYVSDGTLKIVARKEQYTFAGSTKSYTSARLLSKFSFTYGRIEIKAKLPSGVGTWPALWMLGSNITSVGWPACGEIDIMEHWGHDATKISSAIHTVACSGVSGCSNVKVGETTLNDYDTAFHIYSAEWTPDDIKFFLDGQFLYSYNPTPKTADNWPFTQNQFIILNIAMGGDWFDIDPDFAESEMEIDYIRVYQ